jgi:acyl-CoA thioesterase-1
LQQALIPRSSNIYSVEDERNMKRYIALLFLLLLPLPAAVSAGDINIVALGASATYGKGVARSDAFPAQIEKMLKAEGYDVSVKNAGISGNTTADMLSRFESDVPEGTHIVILQPGSNDGRPAKRRSAINSENTINNVDAIVRRLKERKIEVILIRFSGGKGDAIAEKYGALLYGSIYRDIPRDFILNDGQHLSPEGHSVVAKNMLPLIRQLITRSRKEK